MFVERSVTLSCTGRVDTKTKTTWHRQRAQRRAAARRPMRNSDVGLNCAAVFARPVGAYALRAWQPCGQPLRPSCACRHHNAHTLFMDLGDWIAIAAIVISWALYGLGQRASRKRDLEAARALLDGVRAGIAGWGDEYFANPYTCESIEARAQMDRTRVMEQNWIHIYEIPTEPVAALVSGAAASTWINQKTIEAAGVALWQMRLFNELVRQHTDLGRQHLAEILDPSLPIERRETIATAAYQQSFYLHGAIGAAEWYHSLKLALIDNIAQIDDHLVGVAKRLTRSAGEDASTSEQVAPWGRADSSE